MYKFGLVFGLILGLILGVIITYILIEVRKSCIIRNKAYNVKKEIISVLVRQAARWSTASLQDNNPLIAVLHANYGAGYLWALKDIATSEEIENITSIDALKFEREITSTQDLATKKAIKICPKFAPKGYLSKIGGEG